MEETSHILGKFKLNLHHWAAFPSSVGATIALLYKVQYENEALIPYLATVVSELRGRKFDIIFVYTTHF